MDENEALQSRFLDFRTTGDALTNSCFLGVFCLFCASYLSFCLPCVCVVMKLHVTAQSGPVSHSMPLALVLPKGDQSYLLPTVCVCVCVCLPTSGAPVLSIFSLNYLHASSCPRANDHHGGTPPGSLDVPVLDFLLPIWE